jgi:hypothetical protein
MDTFLKYYTIHIADTLNGAHSLVGGFLSAANLDCVMTTTGLVNYDVWNLLVLFMSIFFLLSLRKRLAQIEDRSPAKIGFNTLPPARNPTLKLAGTS